MAHSRIAWGGAVVVAAAIVGWFTISSHFTVREATATDVIESSEPSRLFTRCSPAIVRIFVYDQYQQQVGLGSGFLVSADGLIVTNHHVIKGSATISVSLDTNAQLAVERVVAVDADADLALLKVTGQGLPYLKLTERNAPVVGMRVYAIGSPQGLTNTLSEGLISGIRSTDGRLQTTAPISPGSSGGPLLSADAVVVGVTTSFRTQGQNLNFAVDARQVARLMGHAAVSMQAPVSPPQVAPILSTPTAWLQRAMAEAGNLQSGQSKAYLKVAAGFARLKDKANCNEAARLARISMDEHDLKGGTLEGELVDLLVRCGDVPAARAIADTARNPQTRRSAVDRISSVARRLGDEGTATQYRKLYRQMIEEGWQQHPPSLRRYLGRTLDVREALDVGDVDAAMRVVATMTDTADPEANANPKELGAGPWNERSTGLSDVFNHFVERKDRRRAEETLPLIFDRRDHDNASVKLVLDDLRKGSLPAARMRAASLVTAEAVAQAQTAIARELINRKDDAAFKAAVREAARAAASVKSGADWQWKAIAECLADANQFDPAIVTAERIVLEYFRNDALKHIAVKQVQADQVQAAIRTAARVRGEFFKPWVFKAIVAEQVRKGDDDGALATAAKARGKLHQDRCIVTLAVTQAQSGRFIDAEMTALRFSMSGFDRDTVYAAVAVGQAEAGLAKAAYESAGKIAFDSTRAETYYTIIKSTFAIMSRIDWHAWMAQLKTPEERFFVSIGVAESLLDSTGEPTTRAN